MSLRILAQSSLFLRPLDHHRNDISVSRMSCSGPSSELSTPQRHRGKSRWLRRTPTSKCKSTGKIPRPIFLCAPWWFHRESILWPPSRTPLQPLRHTCNTSSDTCVAIRQWVDIILRKRCLGNKWLPVHFFHPFPEVEIESDPDADRKCHQGNNEHQEW